MTKYDYELEDAIFGPTYGEGLRFTDPDGQEWESVADQKPRTCSLQLNSWKGVSIGAYHYYAKLKWFALAQRNLTTGETARIGGYGDNLKPDEMLGHTITITRPVLRRDITHAREQGELERFGRLPTLKDRTHGFWTEEEARAAAIKWFLAHFKGWRLRDVYDCDSLLAEVPA